MSVSASRLWLWIGLSHRVLPCVYSVAISPRGPQWDLTASYANPVPEASPTGPRSLEPCSTTRLLEPVEAFDSATRLHLSSCCSCCHYHHPCYHSSGCHHSSAGSASCAAAPHPVSGYAGSPTLYVPGALWGWGLEVPQSWRGITEQCEGIAS